MVYEILADIAWRLVPQVRACVPQAVGTSASGRQDEANHILNTKLPRVRKLAKVRTLLEQLLALEPPLIVEQHAGASL